MKLQQLRCIFEVVQNNFNISRAAESIHTSQPGVSKQIQVLEEEIGVQIFHRNGKRLTGLSEPGLRVYESIAEIMREVKNIKNISEEYEKKDSGSFTIATTHTQARYKLPVVVESFVKKYPKINLNIHQGNPSQVTEQILNGDADVGIATESISLNNKIFCIPCYSWNRCLVMQKDHPLLLVKDITLKDLASYPMITYDYAFTGSTIVSKVFKEANINPNIMLTAIDADVIKTYVSLNLGVGLIAEMAFDENKDKNLVSRDVSHLFPTSTTYIGVRQDTFIRGFTFDFISMFTPHMEEKELKIFLKKRHV
ncbi:CysB family HTH-type transcriptional regulator [Methylophilaceae bacterium]|jgi:LysR family cys regulon transcriptional activator|nr:CysB family HTH-type transcriptional regulator [Methylophilaceae bacterium]|tara:strand:- start:755 stop:1684 length:930 start_codon:yes stop_codon:yes gene_type:complete